MGVGAPLLSSFYHQGLFFKTRLRTQFREQYPVRCYGLHPALYVFSRIDFTTFIMKNTAYGILEDVVTTGMNK